MSLLGQGGGPGQQQQQPGGPGQQQQPQAPINGHVQGMLEYLKTRQLYL